ncbi:hypothetical protein QBC32DRAFT_46464 [Pseudoneurospora amorphoporcata]|uniref:Uncharacterized protein n=1 Tax=Pseudoneurospora amorphoporcata TaxID=241081 RepID=A0AAN6SD86_9PEZI|nr:hypothetical protein QBC32DRAFT_46464 [Pseudoneurospora amorphoporcata]
MTAAIKARHDWGPRPAHPQSKSLASQPTGDGVLTPMWLVILFRAIFFVPGNPGSFQRALDPKLPQMLRFRSRQWLQLFFLVILTPIFLRHVYMRFGSKNHSRNRFQLPRTTRFRLVAPLQPSRSSRHGPLEPDFVGCLDALLQFHDVC